ncbi:MAG: NifB/NifX family molybdenum-iron cluster-binding protein [Bacteroidota bacterium]
MNKRFAIPLENGILCAHFGHCEKFAIVDVENNTIGNISELTPPEHQPGLYPRWIAGHGVTDVIAGGIGQKAINLFNDEKINVHVGAPVGDAATLVRNFLNGVLILNGNYCDH